MPLTEERAYNLRYNDTAADFHHMVEFGKTFVGLVLS